MTKVSTGTRVSTEDGLTVSQLGVGVGSGGVSGSLKYPNFDGTAYATIPVWTPKSALWGVEIICTPAEGTLHVMLGDGDTNVDWLRLDASNQTVEFKIGGSATSAFPELVVEAGVEARIVFFGNSTAQTLDCYYNGVKLTQQSIGAALPAFTTVGYKLTNYFVGPIKHVRTFDLSPLQGGSFMPGDGTSRYAAIPQITLSGDFEIEFWMVRQDNPTQTTVRPLSGPADTFRIVVFDSDTGTPNKLEFVQNGNFVGYDSALVGLAQGQNFHLKFVGNSTTVEAFVNGVSKGTVARFGSIQISTVGNQISTPAYGSTQPIANLKITDLTNNNTWEYNNKDDSGSVLVNSDPITGADGATMPTVPSVQTVAIGGPALTQYNVLPSGNLIAGRAYRVAAEVSEYSGSGDLGFISSTGISSTQGRISSNGTIQFTFIASSSGGIDVFNRATNSCLFTMIEIVEVTDGVWYQSGSPMSNAAADAAREQLDWINRKWVFSKEGEIYDLLTGEQATLINLDPSDWEVG